MASIKFFLKTVDAISEWSGKFIAFTILAGIFILVYEVILRYLFNAPAMWTHGTCQRIFAVYYVLAGVYVHRDRAHVNVEILYNRFSIRKKAILNVITSPVFFAFCGVLLWQGIKFAWTSVSQFEPDETPWRAPIYPIKLMIPAGAFLILLQGVANLVRDLSTAITGRVCEY